MSNGFKPFDPNGGAGLANKLDKITTDPQTVAGPVEFLQSITVPSGSIILGKDGAKVGSSARALAYTDARERNTLFAQYYYDDTGGTALEYWDISARQTFNVCPDSGVTLPDPQELAFSGAIGDTLTRAFKIIPKAAGELRVQSWEGSDDTGAVLVDNMFTILVGDIDNITTLELPISTLTESGDMQFVRFSGVQLSGSLSQPSGIFVGQECPFLDSDIHILTKEEVVKQGTDFLDFTPQNPNPPYKQARIYYSEERETLDFYNAVSDLTINLPEESIQPVWNSTGSTINNGQVVKLQGGVTNDLPNVELALADDVDDANASGVATHDIEDGTKGYITIIGSVGGVDTSSFNAGDVLFLSTVTPGGLENVEQQILNPIALCLVSDAVEGVILVKPRGVINITGIAQTSKDTGSPTQGINTTHEPVSAYENTALPLINVNANFTASEGNFECEFQPASIGASGFYRVDFSATCTYGDSKDVIFKVFVNGLETPLGGIMPFASIDPSQGGSVSFSGITSEVIDNTETIEIFVKSDESSGTLTFASCLFSVTRIGNA